MANIHKNVPIHGLIDILGEQSETCKTCSGKTIVVNESSFREGGEFTKTKESLQDAFRKATNYAAFARRQEVYVNKARDKGVTAYSIAISDWFGAPKVLLINLDAWTGKPGQTIRIKARDNVRVAGVTVEIRDAEGKVLETGEAVTSKPGGTWWKYTTKTCLPMKPFPHVEAIARDLAGNQDSFITS
jgi:hypothetical protein